ncbi:hypothetical protein PsorP6_001507 [Peronosclerospora sorghi]|uniref:Uncharacterized protein n=1 Tax=Peronosclerospora sorghi TaxID=230839 RepID=A0ACC0WSY2_9STRA|nr:hypothetical protein PsorP6_001507 [Peronosclerospora sorghi]
MNLSRRDNDCNSPRRIICRRKFRIYREVLASNNKKEWKSGIERKKREKLIRFNASLVGRGFSQTFGIDFDEAYSPVANMASI